MPTATVSVRLSTASYRALQAYLKRRSLVRNFRYHLDLAVAEYLQRRSPEWLTRVPSASP